MAKVLILSDNPYLTDALRRRYGEQAVVRRAWGHPVRRPLRQGAWRPKEHFRACGVWVMDPRYTFRLDGSSLACLRIPSAHGPPGHYLKADFYARRGMEGTWLSFEKLRWLYWRLYTLVVHRRALTSERLLPPELVCEILTFIPVEYIICD